MGKVTDPALLAALDAAPDSPGKVSDPALLAQLEGDNQSRETTLDRVWSQKSAPPLSAMDTASAAVQRAGRGLLPGWNRVQSAMDATFPGGAAAPPQGSTWGERYENAKKGNDRLVGQFDREHPWASPVVGLAGSVPTMLATAGLAGPAGQATSLPSQMKEGFRVGAGFTGLYSLGDAQAPQSVPDLLRLGLKTGVDMTTGGVIGGAVPAILPAMGWAEGKLLQRLNPGSASQAAAQGSAGAGALAGGQSSASAEAQGGSAGAANDSTIVIRPQRRTTLGKVLREPDPIPEAQYLLRQGVPLTKGLYDPASGYGQVELASTSQAGSGPLIRAQRGKALESALDLGFKQAQPPGAKVNLTGDINDKYASLKEAWDRAYDALRASGEKIFPAVHDGKGGQALVSTANRPGLIDQIIDDPGEIWDPQSRDIARRFVNNQMGRLPEQKGAVGRVDLGDMLTVLSNVKAKGREAVRSQKYDVADILGRVQDALEQSVESQASPAVSQRLRELNGKYRDFKIIEDAVIRAGDSASGITPSRFSASVKKAEPSRSRYASGEGGPMRDLSQAINTVFDESASPNNGSRLVTLNDTLNKYVVAPTIYVRNRAAINAMGGGAGAGASSGAGAAAGAAGNSASAAGPAMSPSLPFLPGVAGRLSPQVAAMLAALQDHRSPLDLTAASADQGNER